MKYLAYAFWAFLTVMNLGYAVSGVLKIVDGNRELETYFVLALNAVAFIICLRDVFNSLSRIEDETTD